MGWGLWGVGAPDAPVLRGLGAGERSLVARSLGKAKVTGSMMRAELFALFESPVRGSTKLLGKVV